MKVSKYFCDSCKREMEGGTFYLGHKRASDREFTEVDLCLECYSAVVKLIKYGASKNESAK